jgi:ABC-type ATPase involved in cell division
MIDHLTHPKPAAPSAPPARPRQRLVRVGEDILAPPQVASDGRIPIRTLRAAQVARWFRLPRYSAERAASAARGAYAPLPLPPVPRLLPGTITLLTGPSGAGKSSLLRQTRQMIAIDEPARPWIDLATLPLPDDLPLVDCFQDLPLRDTLQLLGRVGLGEAWSYLRPPTELSDGQRWRFRLARALHMAATRIVAADASGAGDCFPILVCDEFAALLDRVTARVVSRCLRLSIDAVGRLAALVATSHDDLEPALKPDTVIDCDFGHFSTRGEEFEPPMEHR